MNLPRRPSSTRPCRPCRRSCSSPLVLLLSVVWTVVVSSFVTTLPPLTKRRIKTTSSTQHQMFTGIVEEMGKVISLEERDDMPLWDGSVGTGTELTVQGDIVLDGAYLGCSICVSGVCLTATELSSSISSSSSSPDSNNNISNKWFKVGLAPETLRRTYFRNLQPGDPVNLERASEIGGRNSGHFVQGHVDGTGTIVKKEFDGDSLVMEIEVSKDLLPYIVPKGFIAIDGTSLTVVNVDLIKSTFSFMLVEYTQKKIIVPRKEIGDLVNIEVDVLGKYSQSALATLLPRIEALEAKVETLQKELNNKQ